MTDLFFFISHHSLVVLYWQHFIYLFFGKHVRFRCAVFFPRGRLVLFVSPRPRSQGFRFFFVCVYEEANLRTRWRFSSINPLGERDAFGL